MSSREWPIRLTKCPARSNKTLYTTSSTLFSSFPSVTLPSLPPRGIFAFAYFPFPFRLPVLPLPLSIRSSPPLPPPLLPLLLPLFLFPLRFHWHSPPPPARLLYRRLFVRSYKCLRTERQSKEIKHTVNVLVRYIG